jgi:hypothetical protein
MTVIRNDLQMAELILHAGVEGALSQADRFKTTAFGLACEMCRLDLAAMISNQPWFDAKAEISRAYLHALRSNNSDAESLVTSIANEKIGSVRIDKLDIIDFTEDAVSNRDDRMFGRMINLGMLRTTFVDDDMKHDLVMSIAATGTVLMLQAVFSDLELDMNSERIQGSEHYANMVRWALENYNESVARSLVEDFGVHVFTTDNQGDTFLSAVAGNEIQRVSFMLEYESPNPAIRDQNGFGAGTLAAELGHFDIIRILHEKKLLSPLEVNNAGECAIVIACRRANENLLLFLLKEANWNPFQKLNDTLPSAFLRLGHTIDGTTCLTLLLLCGEKLSPEDEPELATQALVHRLSNSYFVPYEWLFIVLTKGADASAVTPLGMSCAQMISCGSIRVMHEKPQQAAANMIKLYKLIRPRPSHGIVALAMPIVRPHGRDLQHYPSPVQRAGLHRHMDPNVLTIIDGYVGNPHAAAPSQRASALATGIETKMRITYDIPNEERNQMQNRMVHFRRADSTVEMSRRFVQPTRLEFFWSYDDDDEDDDAGDT